MKPDDLVNNNALSPPSRHPSKKGLTFVFPCFPFRLIFYYFFTSLSLSLLVSFYSQFQGLIKRSLRQPHVEDILYVSNVT